MRLEAARSDLPKQQVNFERCEFAQSTVKGMNARACSAGIQQTHMEKPLPKSVPEQSCLGDLGNSFVESR